MKTKKTILVAVAVAVMVDGGIWFFTGSPTKHRMVCTSAIVSKGDISNSVTATGTIEPVIEAEVGTQVSGVIDKIYVDYNSVITKGQLIARMGRVTLQSELTSQQTTYDGAKTKFEYQKKNCERSRGLRDKSLVSDTDYEQAPYSYQKAKSAFDSSKTSLAKTEHNLSYAMITSPIDGVVISRDVKAGQTVASGFETPILFTIAADLTQIQAVTDVDETDTGGIEKGQRASFTVNAYPNDVFDGVVTRIRLGDASSGGSASLSASTVITYEVMISTPSPDLKLKPRLTTNVAIFVLDKKDVLSIPNRALRFTPKTPLVGRNDIVKDCEGEHKVWAYKGTTFTVHPAEIGINSGISTEVISGVTEGTRVVTEVTIGAMPDENMNREPGQGSGERSPFMLSPLGNNRKKGNKWPSMKKVVGPQNIRRDFQVREGTVHTLRSVSFTISEGEFVAIMGISGSEKSTLLNTLDCLDAPTSEECLLGDISMRTMSKPQRAVLRDRKIGFVFQGYNLLPETTAVGNVELPLTYNSSASASGRRRRAIRALQAIGLGDRLEHKSNQIPGGQIQRVAIAHALISNPAVILADEATGSLDTRTSFDIFVLFQELHTEGRTIIFVAHNPEIAQYSSRNIRLRNGYVIKDTVNSHVLPTVEALTTLPKSDKDWR